jgi:putative integral membrane protein (TIGR02587 family)
MKTAAQKFPHATGVNRDYAIGLARAFGGAVIFGLPLLMTMEMWFLGFYMDRERLLLFLFLNFAMLVGLSRFVGFETTSSWFEDVLDAIAASGVGIVASLVVLSLFGVLEPHMPARELVGKIAVQSIPASFGAILARKELGGAEDDREEQEREERAGYGAQLFLMMAGALFVTFNMAPTEEMVLIGFMMSPGQAVALVLFSLLVLHAFVYGVGFSGQEAPHANGFSRTFVANTIAGYGVALLVSLFVLWSFGRTDGADPGEIARMMIVLGFPAAVGAAIARLVV